MIWLESGREATRRTECVAKTGNHSQTPRNRYQVLVSHKLRHSCHYFGRNPYCCRRDADCVGTVVEQPFAKSSNGEVTDRCKSLGVKVVLDGPRDFVPLWGDNGILEKNSQRQVRQSPLGRDSMLSAFGRDARQLVS